MIRRPRRRAVVEFVDLTDRVADEYRPRPAKLNLPGWYKETGAYVDGKREAYMDERGFVSATIKKCLPFYDAMSAGYLIFSPDDVEVTDAPVGKFYRWPSIGVAFHPKSQLGKLPVDLGESNGVAKWASPWSIRTPRGYSCLIVNPIHRQTPTRIFEGVVDTDTYLPPIQFPFVLTDPKFTGIIPAGTPIAQVIPFRRESFRHEVLESTEERRTVIEKSESRLRSTFFNGYKERFWSPKDYR